LAKEAHAKSRGKLYISPAEKYQKKSRGNAKERDRRGG